MKQNILVIHTVVLFLGLVVTPHAAVGQPSGSGADVVYTRYLFSFQSGNSVWVSADVTTTGPGQRVWFEWGPTTSYGSATGPVSWDALEGPWIYGTLYPLTPWSTIHCRVVSQSGDRISVGQDTTFMARDNDLASGIVTMAPTGITPTSVTLHGRCTILGMDTRVFFVYSLPYRGNITATTIQHLGQESGEYEVSAYIKGLVPNMPYSYSLKSECWTDRRGAPAYVDGATVSFATLPADGITGIIIPLLYRSAIVRPHVLRFGVHTIASDSIDISLGEFEVPPMPPQPNSDIRLIGRRTGLGTYLDLHKLASPAQVDTYRVIFALQPDQFPIFLSWPELTHLYAGPVTLKAGLTRVDMKTTTSWVMDDPDLTGFRIIAALPTPLAGPPEAVTDPVSNLSGTGGMLGGHINANGLVSTAWFEWGKTTSYGWATPEQAVGIDAGNVAANAFVHGLAEGTLYHYRIVARNAGGQIAGTDHSFTTLEVTAPPPGKAQPRAFGLSQNYPNPFNPATTIKYELAAEARVRLTIYDMLGRPIAVPEEGLRSAGSHAVDWNASSVATGVYFYRLDAIERDGKAFSSVKKLVIAR